MKKNIKRIISEIENKSLIILTSSEATHGLKRSLRNLLKEVSLFKSHISALKKRGRRNSTYVQIGGGNHYLDGFLNIDIVPPADVIWDVREGIPLKFNSVKFIFSEHFLEHIDYPVSVKKFVKECYRVLKRDGKVVIGVPDGELAVRAYYKTDNKMIDRFMRKWYSKRNCLNHYNTPIDFLNYHFRDQDDNEKYRLHFWAYDRKKLKSLLKEAGFRKIGVWRLDPRIANIKRKFGSIYIYGIK